MDWKAGLLFINTYLFHTEYDVRSLIMQLLRICKYSSEEIFCRLWRWFYHLEYIIMLYNKLLQLFFLLYE
jgi:hypothetical protein